MTTDTTATALAPRLKERLKDIKLSDLLDIPVLQTLSNSFFNLTGMTVAILDLDGNILVASGWTKICTDFHRKTPASCSRCRESDTILANKLKKGQQFNLYKCKNGLIDIATPIIIEGMHLGNLFSGQFLFETPDKEYFKKQAEQFGFDKIQYMEALGEVPVVSGDQIKKTMRFLSDLTVFIGASGIDKQKLKALTENLEQEIEAQTLILRQTNEKLKNEIDERKKIETALIKSRENYKNTYAMMKALFDAIPDVLGVQDTGHRIIRYNEAGYKFINKSPEEAKGLKCYEIIGRDRPCSICATSETYKTLKPARREKFVEELGVWLDVRSYPVFGDNGELSMVIEHLRDITDLKNAELTIRSSEKKYRQIFNATNDGIVIQDRKTGKMLDINEKMLSMYGYPKEEIIGMSLESLGTGVAPYRKKNADEKIREAIDQGSVIFEWESMKKSGETFWSEVNLRFSDIDDGDRIIAVFRDITKRKKTQDIMVQTEKMMSVGGLAAGMAHEINNPLAGMMQNASVMKSRLKSMDMPANLRVADALGISMADITAFMEKRDIFRMIDAIHESGSRAAKIVNSMLSFARRSDAATSSHHPAELMEKILELAETDYDLKKRYDFKSIEIVKEYARNLPSLICEGGKIQQVLLNILRNGAQAMQEARTNSPRFTLRIYSSGMPKMVHIEIEDNGPGMDEQTRLKVFDPFFTTKPVGVGTGLGLSVSYFIITENHKGKMEVISEPGKGTNFIIRLPVTPR